MLAHVNKHRDGDGKLIFAGTSDIVDDCDCAYYLDEVSSSAHTKSVLFENFKSRGDVDREVGYTYSIAEDSHTLNVLIQLSRWMNQRQ